MGDRLCDFCKEEFGEWCSKHNKDLWSFEHTPDFCDIDKDFTLIDKIDIEELKKPCYCDYDLSKSIYTCDISFCDYRETMKKWIDKMSDRQNLDRRIEG